MTKVSINPQRRELLGTEFKINIPTVFKEIKEGTGEKKGIENMSKRVRVKWPEELKNNQFVLLEMK